MREYTISIIIPTYNRQEKIKRCINSIINQITLNDEIIVIDDCSTDNTMKILTEIKKKYNNVIIEKNHENKGTSYSRNKGLDIAKGDIILFIDSDDICTNDMIKEYIKIYDNTNADLICSGFIYKTEEKLEETKKIYNLNKLCNTKIDILENILEYEKIGLFFSACNKVYLKKIIDNKGIRFNAKTSNMEDYEFNCEYIKYCNLVYFSNKAFYYYMITKEESLSSKYIPNLFERFDIIKGYREEIYKKILQNDKTQEIILELNIEYLCNCINNLYRKDCEMNKKTRKKILNKILRRQELRNNKNFKAGNKYTKIMLNIIKIKNVFIIDIIFRLLHFFKKVFGQIYFNYFRKKLIKRKV